MLLRSSPRPARSLLVAVFCCLGLLATACGGSDEPEAITSDELFAPSDDALDLTTKPPVADEFLVDVDELITTDLVVGDGDTATAGSPISMRYVGVLASDGSEFDASWNRGAEFPFTLGAGQVIPGWDEGIVGMKVGGRRVLQIPSELAYRDTSPTPAIPPGSDLVFIVDLVEVQPPPEPTPTPQPSPPVPEDALGSFGNLGIIDLVEGSGRAAEFGDILSVNYVGVDAITGEEFDSSWARSAPFTLVAGRSPVIDGWNEGLIGAQAGTERILQIPADMAYGEGDLVFRVHVEEVIEAPLAHTLTFTGSPPTETETTTLVEGDGTGAKENDVVNTHLVVIRHSDGSMLQSTYETDSPAPLFVSAEGLLPGLNDAVIGIKPGEIRQIVLPADVAFPDGPPPSAGVAPGDALVFVLDVIDITEFVEDDG